MRKYILLFIATTILMSASNAQNIINTNKQNKMKEYILLNRVPADYGAEEAKKVREAWNKVTDNWKADNIFVTSYVFPNEGYVISGAEQTVNKEVVVTQNLKIVSTIILKAASLEEAVELAKACPILSQGGTVEVNAVLPRVPQP